jgi:ATP-binding cassette, subfamily B, bacterial
MSTTLNVPAWIRGCMEAHGLAHRPILLLCQTDVALDGSPADHWLVITPAHICLLEEARGGQLLSVVASDDVSGARTHTGVGSGVLQLKIGQEWIDWLRYSNALATRFHKLSRMLENYCDDADRTPDLLVLNHDDSNPSPLDPPRCGKCRLRLSNHDESCPRCVPKGQVLRRVIDLLRPYTRGALALCALTVVGVGAELIPPKLQQLMVDQILTLPAASVGSAGAVGTATPETQQVDFKVALLVVVLALAFSRLLLSAVGVFKGQLATRIGTGLTSTLRAQMVAKLQNMAVAYYDRHQVGSMLSRVAHDSEVLHGLMYQFTGGFLLQIVQLVGVGLMLLWINPKLAMFTLIPVPLVFLGSWVFWCKVYPRHYRLWDASSKQMTVLSGMLSGIRVVKAFGQEDREFERFRQASDHLRDWRLWVENTNAHYSAAMQIVFSLGGLIVWYVGGRDVIGGDMTLGQLIAFLAYLAMFYAPLGALSSFTTWLTSFLSGSQRVLELLDTPLAITDAAQPQAWDAPRGAIRFSNVSFGYDRNQPVLKNISFEVAAGEMVGIVGRSGSGKTTMVNLLGRFYDVQEGSITVDGIDIRQISRQQLRERLGIVFQDSFLFRGTIWKNLAYGCPKTDMVRGLEAAKAAGAHDFICRQPLAYETLLGEHGAGLSGGEKQRLSIARTLLYDPRILVLDEATSNIDAEAERSIQQALEVLIRGRTTVAIAHRLSTLRNADRILVFDRGRLAEQGSHAELVAEDGIYARLVRMQTQVTKSPSIDALAGAGDASDVLDEDAAVASVESSASAARGATAIAGSQRRSHRSGNHDSQKYDSQKYDSQKYDSRKYDSGKYDSQEYESQRYAAQAYAAAGNGEEEADDAAAGLAEIPEDGLSSASLAPGQFLTWLDPEQFHFAQGLHGRLELWQADTCVAASVFAVRTFPAAHPAEFISIRGWNESGDEVEHGMILALSDWTGPSQALISESLGRRYLLREILAVHHIDLRHGYLDFDVDTDHGRYQFTMRWTQSQGLDFGDTGKLLIDTEENRYVVRDVQALPVRDRERFLQYVYW